MFIVYKGKPEVMEPNFSSKLFFHYRIFLPEYLSRVKIINKKTHSVLLSSEFPLQLVLSVEIGSVELRLKPVTT